jgi:iron complex transport system substrate-binding protein
MVIVYRLYRKHIQRLTVLLLLIALFQGCYGMVNQADYPLKKVASDCQMVQHEFGESCIPRRPKRAIVMDQESLEILLAVGINPIATTTPNLVGSKLPILQDRIRTIENLGKEGQPNLEKIVQLKPDLIMGLYLTPQLYSLLSQIAPTLPIQYSQTGWKDILRQVAKILDRSQEAKKLLIAYQQRIETLRSRFAQKTGSLKVCVMRFYTNVQLTQFLNDRSFQINILEELKVLSIPEFQRQQQQLPHSDWGYVMLSLENINWLNADVMFVALDPGAEKSFQQYTDNPLWQTLKAVKQHQIYTVSSGHWIFGNILSANAILDDLVKYLLDS